MLYQNVGELQKIVRQSQTEQLLLERIFAKYHKVRWPVLMILAYGKK